MTDIQNFCERNSVMHNKERIHLLFPPKGGKLLRLPRAFSAIDEKIRDGYGVDGCGRKVVGTAEVDTDPAIALSVI
jgi:hypothetical protein